jgi:hypothetical protein
MRVVSQFIPQESGPLTTRDEAVEMNAYEYWWETHKERGH